MKLAIDQTTAVVSFMNQPFQLPGGSYCFSKADALRVLTLLVCLLYGLGALSQTTYYVKTTGNDAGNGTSWASAFKTLQKALATAGTTGDRIWIAKGTYYPTLSKGKAYQKKILENTL